MLKLNDYKILQQVPLTLPQNVSLHRVSKRKGENYLLFVLNYHLDEAQIQDFLSQVMNRIAENRDPFVLKFHDFCHDQDAKTVYILTEDCPNGTLKNYVLTSKTNILQEEFLCKILYHILVAFKILGKGFIYLGLKCLEIDEIFVSDCGKIKLLNFNFCRMDKKRGYKHITVSDLIGTIFDNLLSGLDLDLYYSVNFVSLVSAMTRDHSYLHKSIDKLLCNRVILTKSFQLSKNDTKSDTEILYWEKLQHLKIKEFSLKVREDKLREREDVKPIIQNITNRKIEDCKKFARSRSERRIRFKGHSPLKDLTSAYNNRNSVNNPNRKIGKSTLLEVVPESSDDNVKSRKSLSFAQIESNEQKCRPISWTDENKKCAFELLRVMNSGAILTSDNVKHTFL